MLRIAEHFQFYTNSSEHLNCLLQAYTESFILDNKFSPKSIYFKGETNRPCLSISINEEHVSIESSYYIGLGWLRPWDKPVLIEPKVNSDSKKLDHIKMLVEALKEPENLNHLDGLMDIHFDEEWIPVEGDYEVSLTPFLVAQFLMTVRSIVRKGLKKEYYSVTENLQSRIKGKVLVSQQIRDNVVRNRLTNTVCSYQEFGVDSAANRFLKYVLKYVSTQLHNFQEKSLKDTLIEPLTYCLGGFQTVSDEKFYQFKQKENNPLYREYNIAIQLGNQILQLMDHNLTKTSEVKKIYPPHWIDMSKLFELYVFKKLREKFTGYQSVQYHVKANYQELDFLINDGDFKAVVDAKYKPRYKSGNPSMEDARQISGYARMNKIYSILKVSDNQLIPAYIIYPSELKYGEEVDSDKIEEVKMNEMEKLIKESEVRKSTVYKEIYMQEVSLNFSLF
jgi:5-methylcytosine-specific restriction enzyme subunit McrC